MFDGARREGLGWLSVMRGVKEGLGMDYAMLNMREKIETYMLKFYSLPSALSMSGTQGAFMKYI